MTGELNQGRFLGLDTMRLQKVSVVCFPVSDSVCPPALGFRKDREEEGFVDTETIGADWTFAVTKWFSCCCSRIASWFRFFCVG